MLRAGVAGETAPEAGHAAGGATGETAQDVDQIVGEVFAEVGQVTDEAAPEAGMVVGETALDVGQVLWGVWDYISNNPLLVFLLGTPVLVLLSGKLHIILRLRLWLAKRTLDKGDAKRAQSVTERFLQRKTDDALGMEILAVHSETFIKRTEKEQQAYERALEFATDAINKQKCLADAYLIQGRAYSLSDDKGDHKKAMEDFDKAEGLGFADKKGKVVYLYRGIEYCVREQYDKAIADLDKAPLKALKRKWARVDGFFWRGIAHYGKGEYRLAIEDYTAALAIKPDDHTALNNRGLAYDHQGEYEAAIADFTAALDIKWDYLAALNNRGLAYDHQGKYEAAIADFTAALAIKPDLHEALNNRGLAYDGKGDLDRAIADWEAAARLMPDDAMIKRNLAMALAAKAARDGGNAAR
jgi:tetratricopeptide (TPR) repeat protein